MNTVSSFGVWVKRARKHSGFTQEALADLILCSVSLLRKIESGQRRPSADMVRRLAEVLAIAHNERPLFLRLANTSMSNSSLQATTSPTSSGLFRSSRIPVPPTPLIGRTALLAQILERLRHPATRLLTLTGAPGIGKTRIAIEAALHIHNDFADGVSFVELAAVRDGVDAASALLVAVNERPDGRTAEAQVLALFQRRQSLLVLDNCEHLLADPTLIHLISRLLAACPFLKVVATSRTALYIRAERRIDVPPLSLPDRREWNEPNIVMQSEAVAFFLDRVQAIDAAYVLTSPTAAPIAELCQRLDCVPLALELIATRAADLPPAELLVQMQQRLPWLNDGPRDLPARQRTLRDAIRWSYDLLTPDEQSSFVWLSVFAGGFTAAAAAAIGADQSDRLYRHALLQCQVDPDGRTRYSMLEAVREFAREYLQQRGEDAFVDQCHAELFLAFARQAEEAFHRDAETLWLTMIDDDLDNLRTAMRWSLAHESGATAARIAVALLSYWRSRGLLQEGSRWLGQALASDDSAIPPAERAQMWYTLGFLQSQYSDERAAQAFAQSLDISRSLHDLLGVARILRMLGMLARYPGNLEQAITLLTESYTLLQTYGGTVADMSATLNQLGAAFGEQGQHQQAEQYYREAIALISPQKVSRNVHLYHLNIAEERWRQGDYVTAADMYDELLQFGRTHGDTEVLGGALSGSGRIALHQGDLAAARDAFAESLALFNEMGLAFAKAFIPPYIAYIDLYQHAFDDAERAASEALSIACAHFAIESVIAACAVLAAHGLSQGQTERATQWLGSIVAIRKLFAPDVDHLFVDLVNDTTHSVQQQMGQTEWARVDHHVQQEVFSQVPAVQFATVYEARRAIDLWTIISTVTARAWP